MENAKPSTLQAAVSCAASEQNSGQSLGCRESSGQRWLCWALLPIPPWLQPAPLPLFPWAPCMVVEPQCVLLFPWDTKPWDFREWWGQSVPFYP